MDDIISWFAMGFDLGLSPVLPGTVGALPGLLLTWRLVQQSPCTQLLATAILIAVAIPICDIASDALGGGDDDRIVADEFMLFPLAVVGQAVARQPWALAGVFLASRVLDGLKPPPAAHVESVAGGLGIVFDDMVANIYSWVLLGACYAAYRLWCHIKGRRP